MKILRWNPISQGSSKSSWRMPIQEGLIKTTSSPLRLSSRTKIEKRKMLRKAVSTLFPPNLSDVKALDTWNKSAQHISISLGKARPLLLPWLTPSLRMIRIIRMMESWMPSIPLWILLRGLMKKWVKKRTWGSQSLRKWMNRMTSTQPMQNSTRSRKSMRNYIAQWYGAWTRRNLHKVW